MKAKKSHVLSEIRAATPNALVYSRHALERMGERDITPLDVARVLRTGRRDEEKDAYDHELEQWNYSLQGRIVDGRRLRVAVAVERHVVVITVIVVS